jgi:hypothetical protein
MERRNNKYVYINYIILFLFGSLVGSLVYKTHTDIPFLNSKEISFQSGNVTIEQKYSRFEEILKLLKKEYYDQDLLLS